MRVEILSPTLLFWVKGIIIYFTREQLSEKDVNTMSYTALIKHTRVYQEAFEEGRQEGLEQRLEQGRKQEAADGIFRLLKKRFGQDLSEEMLARISSLPLPTLRRLTEDLLDFNSLADLQPWLDTHQ